MRVSSLVAVLAATSLIAMPALAASAGNPALGLSLAGGARAGTSTGKHNSKLGGTSLLLVGLGAAAVIGGAVALGSGHHHHDNMPASS